MPDGTRLAAKGVETYSVESAADHAPKARITWSHAMSRGDWSVRSETETDVTRTRDTWEIRARLRAWGVIRWPTKKNGTKQFREI